MCNVHLIPDVSEIRRATKRLTCDECSQTIEEGQEYRHIDGKLDDGSDERYVYQAHDDCFTLAESDVGEDGCFRYGGAKLASQTRET